MKGKVVSYISAKKFGFINGEDGESYFLHVSSLIDKANEVKLVRDVIVEFEPAPTPKGLAAKQVHVPEVFFKKQPVPFFTARSNQPKHGQVAARHTLSTRFFKDPNEGRSYIKELAAGTGCNAILNMDVEKRTFSSGNYKFTMHAFSGDFALVTEDVPCSKTASSDSLMQLDADVATIADQFDIANQAEIKAREKQLSSSKAGLLIFVAVIFIVGLLFVT